MDDTRITNYIIDVPLAIGLIFFIGSFIFFPIAVNEGPSHFFWIFLSGRWTYDEYGQDMEVGTLGEIGFPKFIMAFLILGTIGAVFFSWLLRVIDLEKLKGRIRLRLEIVRTSRILLSITNTLGFVGAFYFRKNILLLANPTTGFYIAMVYFTIYAILGFVTAFFVPVKHAGDERSITIQNLAEIIVHDPLMTDFEEIFKQDFQAVVAKDEILQLFDRVINEKMLVEELTNDYELMAKPFSLVYANQINDFKEITDSYSKDKRAIAENLIEVIEAEILSMIS